MRQYPVPDFEAQLGIPPAAIHRRAAWEIATAALPDRLRRRVCTAVSTRIWKPGYLHPNLSWTHYRTLLRVDKAEARAFYEIEAIKNNWAARELERQINSLLYERLALSRDKKGLMRLA